MQDDKTKAQVQARFSQFAEGYVTSANHAKGGELDRLVELAQPQTDWQVLDVATGGGHTALKFAPLVAQVVAADFSQAMLYAAREQIAAAGQANVCFINTDAEALALASNTFDLVTCRIAPHHFPDCFRFMQECQRVLKPGGLLLVQDHVLPDEPRAAQYINAFQRLRDPSHVRGFAAYEWQGMYLDAGLSVIHSETTIYTTRLLPWAQRQGRSAYIIERLQIMLHQAPNAVRPWLNPQYATTPDATFEQRYILIAGRKPA